MKQLSLRQCIVLLRTCIVLLLLCIISVFLFSFIATKPIENSKEKGNAGTGQQHEACYAANEEQNLVQGANCRNCVFTASLLPSLLSEQFMQ